MPRYFIRLAYNGTNYCGWQVQPNAVTVQSTLDKYLHMLLQVPIETVGCGRTDTGVHAADFYVHIDLEKPLADKAQITFKLNKVLPADIAIKEIVEVTPDGHARFSATVREYEYRITRKKSPFLQNTAYFHYGNLDIDAMNQAAAFLPTITDFKAFSRTHTDTKTTLCNVTQAYWKVEGDILVFTITANRFLRNMVRAVVGTLIDVGRGKITQEEFKNIALSLNRAEAGDSAPAEGLFLTRVEYPAEIFIV